MCNGGTSICNTCIFIGYTGRMMAENQQHSTDKIATRDRHNRTVIHIHREKRIGVNEAQLNHTNIHTQFEEDWRGGAYVLGYIN